MKKILRLLSASLLLLVAVVVPQDAFAQKGEMALGLKGGYATYNDGGYAGVYFHYTFADHFRIAPDIGYAFGNEGKSAFLMDIDMQFPFRLVRAFNVYPLAGFTLNSWSYKGDSHATRVGANFGAGFDIKLTDNLKINIAGKYSLMKDTGGGFFDAGIAYVF